MASNRIVSENQAYTNYQELGFVIETCDILVLYCSRLYSRQYCCEKQEWGRQNSTICCCCSDEYSRVGSKIDGAAEPSVAAVSCGVEGLQFKSLRTPGPWYTRRVPRTQTW